MRVSAVSLAAVCLPVALALPQHSHTYDQPSGQGSDLSSTRSPWSRENNNNNGNHENYKFQGNKYANANNGNNPAAQQVAAQRAAAVKDAFQTAWNGYYEYAFPNDELLPVNNSFSNSRNGWGASAIDALTTATVMQIPEIVNEILAYVPNIDFSKSYQNEPVSLFETTIRYMGGLLAGYDLLKGPLDQLPNNTGNVDACLTQAKTLADHLSFAFSSPSGIPHNNLFFNDSSFDNSTTNGLATIGTLVLEWTHLSDLTGDPSYASLTQRAESYLLNPQPATSEPFPGLVGTNVNISNGMFTDAEGGWSGGDDSFYEYLLKMYVYDSSRFGHFLDRWILAADSTIAHLTSHPSSRPDLTFVAEYSGTNLLFRSGHLTCFDGGNFLLGGSVLNRTDYVDFGLALVNGCHDTYNSTLTGIGPETFSWNTTNLPANQTAFYEAAGFYITDSQYILRPEVIESFYYAYRVTGDTKYQDWAWGAFQAIVANTRVGSGFSEISDVNAVGGGTKKNFQDSFLFAEVLKYSYLIHTQDDVWQINHNGTNEFVFNTEAHPFKVAGPPV
ncbi:putative 1,2-alpha-mannosidase [Cryomyces antarcticus]